MKPKPTLWLAIIPGKPGIQILFRKPRRAWWAQEVEVIKNEKKR